MYPLQIVGCLVLELLRPIVSVALERGFIEPQAFTLEESKQESK